MANAKKPVPWVHMVDARGVDIHFEFRDAEVAADTAVRLRNLGLVVMVHSRPAEGGTRLYRMAG